MPSLTSPRKQNSTVRVRAGAAHAFEPADDTRTKGVRDGGEPAGPGWSESQSKPLGRRAGFGRVRVRQRLVQCQPQRSAFRVVLDNQPLHVAEEPTHSPESAGWASSAGAEAPALRPGAPCPPFKSPALRRATAPCTRATQAGGIQPYLARVGVELARGVFIGLEVHDRPRAARARTPGPPRLRAGGHRPGSA